MVSRYVPRLRSGESIRCQKCENCTTRERPTPTMAMRLEHAESTASSVSSGRQPSIRSAVVSDSNRIARTSASSSIRRGRKEATSHRNRRCACFHFSSGISNNVRSYVSSSVVGSSFRIRRILEGKHRRSVSNWQNTHLNLNYSMRNDPRLQRQEQLTSHLLPLSECE
jgi:hypothetical protein